jgi:hypothetical protein
MGIKALAIRPQDVDATSPILHQVKRLASMVGRGRNYFIGLPQSAGPTLPVEDAIVVLAPDDVHRIPRTHVDHWVGPFADSLGLAPHPAG